MARKSRFRRPARDAPAAAFPGANSEAAIAIDHASRNLQQLCKHFAHKLPVTLDEHAGEISFSVGDCRLKAEDIEQSKDVVVSHLVRFAFRAELHVNGQDA